MKNDERETSLQEKARTILSADNVLIGYELEDSEFHRIRDKEIKQFLVRPIEDHNFKELWEHGRKCCSKFTIYLIAGALFCERRPDMLNYKTNDDAMYGKDIISGAKDIHKELVRVFKQETVDQNIESKKKMLCRRIDWAVSHLVEVVDLGNHRYNILFEEY